MGNVPVGGRSYKDEWPDCVTGIKRGVRLDMDREEEGLVIL
jgi:hypothetical protein